VRQIQKLQLRNKICNEKIRKDQEDQKQKEMEEQKMKEYWKNKEEEDKEEKEQGAKDAWRRQVKVSPLFLPFFQKLIKFQMLKKQKEVYKAW